MDAAYYISAQVDALASGAFWPQPAFYYCAWVDPCTSLQAFTFMALLSIRTFYCIAFVDTNFILARKTSITTSITRTTSHAFTIFANFILPAFDDSAFLMTYQVGTANLPLTTIYIIIAIMLVILDLDICGWK